MESIDGPDSVKTRDLLRQFSVIANGRSAALASEMGQLERDIANAYADFPAEEVYTLHAILVHSGSPDLGGHYWSYIRDHKSGKWFKFNDVAVDQVANMNEVMAECFGDDKGFTSAYALMYVKLEETLAWNDLSGIQSWARGIVDSDNANFDGELRRWKERHPDVPAATGTARSGMSDVTNSNNNNNNNSSGTSSKAASVLGIGDAHYGGIAHVENTDPVALLNQSANAIQPQLPIDEEARVMQFLSEFTKLSVDPDKDDRKSLRCISSLSAYARCYASKDEVLQRVAQADETFQLAFSGNLDALPRDKRQEFLILITLDDRVTDDVWAKLRDLRRDFRIFQQCMKLAVYKGLSELLVMSNEFNAANGVGVALRQCGLKASIGFRALWEDWMYVIAGECVTKAVRRLSGSSLAPDQLAMNLAVAANAVLSCRKQDQEELMLKLKDAKSKAGPAVTSQTSWWKMFTDAVDLSTSRFVWNARLASEDESKTFTEFETDFLNLMGSFDQRYAKKQKVGDQ